MTLEFSKKLVCPFDKRELSVRIFKMQDDEIQEGILVCTHCQRYYPVVFGVPIMSPDEYRETTLELPLLEKWGIDVKALTNSSRPGDLLLKELPDS